MNLCAINPSLGSPRNFMERVEFAKCFKCKKVKHVSELTENPESIGFICIDEQLCARERLKNETENEDKAT